MRFKAIVTILLMSLSLAAPAWADTREVTLDVMGMVCPACPPNVQNALESVDGVTHVEMKPRERQAIVRFDPVRTNVEALLQATDDAGYPSTLKK